MADLLKQRCGLVSASACISRASKSLAWAIPFECLVLLTGEMEASGMTPDVISFNTVINLCAHDGRPEEAPAISQAQLVVRRVESSPAGSKICISPFVAARAGALRPNMEPYGTWLGLQATGSTRLLSTRT